MKNNFVLQTVVNGGTVTYPCKFHKDQWFGEIRITYSFLFKRPIVTVMGKSIEFSSIYRAVDYFTTIAFSKDNLSHLYDEISGGKYKIAPEEIEYMTNEEFESLTKEARCETNKKLDDIVQVYGVCVNDISALGFIEVAKKESQNG